MARAESMLTAFEEYLRASLSNSLHQSCVHASARMTKIVCTQYIDPTTIEPLKEDVAHASGSLQLCAGQKSGSEAAVHAMHAIFEA